MKKSLVKIMMSHPFICSYLCSPTHPSIQQTILPFTNMDVPGTVMNKTDSLCTHAQVDILIGKQMFNNCKCHQVKEIYGMEVHPRQSVACLYSFIHTLSPYFAQSSPGPSQGTLRSTTKHLLNE